jgi:hypothetical protein
MTIVNLAIVHARQAVVYKGLSGKLTRDAKQVMDEGEVSNLHYVRVIRPPTALKAGCPFDVEMTDICY